MSTIIVASLFLGLLVALIFLWILFLRVGLRWAKVQDVTMRRVAFAAILLFALHIALIIVSYLVSPSDPAPALIFGIAKLVAGVLIPCFVIIKVFKASFFRALQAWLPTLLAPIIVIAFLFLIFRPFLIEAFHTPTNAMAPTLLGNHWQGTCVECGNPAFCSRLPQQYASPDRSLMICRDNFHVTQPTDRGDKAFSSDHFLVAKFLRPQRWDIVAFRNPEEPTVLYVMRLVGLPGEEITIKDGQIWADGEMLTPPDSIRGIKYLSEIGDGYGELWGSPDHPAKLAEDEYFVLGDFSRASYDSRLWKRGAPGHNPFAVPESHLYGIVTHTYWPPGRWRTFR
jgi:signal peptidase I